MTQFSVPTVIFNQLYNVAKILLGSVFHREHPTDKSQTIVKFVTKRDQKSIMEFDIVKNNLKEYVE